MLWGGRRDFLPGSQGVLAAYVLERITGQSWEAYTRIVPLGMTTASFGPLGLEQANAGLRNQRLMIANTL